MNAKTLSHPSPGIRHLNTKKKPSRKGWVSSNRIEKLPLVMMMMTMMMACCVRRNDRANQHGKSDYCQ
jgi:hypothetical protein